MSFKVKISDGSVVGPLDSQMLGSWYQQGLIDAQTPVMSESTGKWHRLRDVMELGDGSGPRSKKQSSDAGELYLDDDYEDARPTARRGGRLVAGAMLIAAAGAAVAARLAPGVWRPDLSPTPWAEMGWILLLLGLTAVHGAEWSRRVARVGVGLGAFALFPVAGLLIAQGVPVDGLAVLLSAWIAASGVFFLLSPSMPLARLAAAVVVALAGAYGVVRFGVIAGSAAAGAAQSGWFTALLK
jgi:hypothetical protein